VDGVVLVVPPDSQSLPTRGEPVEVDIERYSVVFDVAGRAEPDANGADVRAVEVFERSLESAGLAKPNREPSLSRWESLDPVRLAGPESRMRQG